MNIIKPLNKAFSAAGSLGGLAADVVEGTIDIGSKTKKVLEGEINSLQYERDMENATSRILAKAKYIKQISEALHITASEAEELLNKEVSNGQS